MPAPATASGWSRPRHPHHSQARASQSRFRQDAVDAIVQLVDDSIVPELPDVSVYVEALQKRIVGHRFVRALVKSPFLLRSAEPPLSATYEKMVVEVRRVGKRIAVGVEDDLWLVLHLMIAGRLHWNAKAPKLGGRNNLAAFEFDNGWLWLTEAGTQRRASLTVVEGEAGLQALSA